MSNQSNMINILTYKLPFKLAGQIFNEFQSRFSEAKYLIDNYSTYNALKDDMVTIELLLSLSIFYKRVIASLDAGAKFHKTVTLKSNADTIKIGSYALTPDEKNKILAVVISYNKLIKKFSISPNIFEYQETSDFLTNLIRLKSSF